MCVVCGEKGRLGDGVMQLDYCPAAESLFKWLAEKRFVVLQARAHGSPVSGTGRDLDSRLENAWGHAHRRCMHGA